MWRWTKRALIAGSITLVGAALTGAAFPWIVTRKEMAATPPPGRLVDIGGYRLHLWCVGAGEPTVILETGLGGSSVDRGFVQPDVAGFSRVCSYDRAGMGYSDPGPAPRTARRIARELAALVDSSGINGPLVLVAASIGGYAARVFTSEYHDRVAALVRIETTRTTCGLGGAARRSSGRAISAVLTDGGSIGRSYLPIGVVINRPSKAPSGGTDDGASRTGPSR